MSRLWLGVGILLGLLVLGIFTAACADRLHAGISDDLALAAESAEVGQWHRAQDFFFRAKDTWQRTRNVSAAITDHEPMEEIDRLFAQGSVYLTQRNPNDFQACCQALSVLVEAIAEAQAFNWWNFL